MLHAENAVLLIVDVQGKLAQLMYRKEELFANLQRCVCGARVLGLPIILVEQNPDGLGPTIPEVAGLLEGVRPISKFSFSCCGNDGFMDAVKSTNRTQILITGIEAHVCIYQTARDLLAQGYGVQVIADAVSSRTAENKQIGLDRIKSRGGVVTSVEMALFEMLKEAKGDKFKEILRVVR